MNQKVINIILAAGILISLALFISNKNQAGASSTSKVDVAQSLKVAYVDLDTIQSKYTFYQEKMQEFEKKKETADRDLNNAFQKIDNERVAFLKRGESITQAEAENFQRVYQGKMQNLEEQKKNMENDIAEDGLKTMEELRNKMNDFLEEYNKKAKYSFIFSYSTGMNVLFYKDSAYNITAEVIEGLNQSYKKSNSSNK
jgi:outer membrane protein